MKTLKGTVDRIKKIVQREGNRNVRSLEQLFMNYPGTDWKELLEYKNGKPINTVLHQDKHLKILLICWEGGQKSKKHGHPAGGGLIRVMSGTLLETRFDPQQENHMTGRYYLDPNSGAAYIHDDEALHIVENPSDEPAVSLHMYSYGIAVAENMLLHQHRDRVLSSAA